MPEVWNAVRGDVDAERHGTPAFLAVRSGSGYTYRRDDGVLVLPIGVLGP